MRRVPFWLWLVPGIMVLPLASGRLLETPSWLKLGLVAAALALPAVVVVARYRPELDSADPEFLRRRWAAFSLFVLVVVSAVWMVGGVDVEAEVRLDSVVVGDADAVRFDVSFALPPGGSLRDLTVVGGGVRAFFPRPEDPRVYRLLLSEPPGGNDIGIVVTWRLPVWRGVGDVAVSAVPVADES